MLLIYIKSNVIDFYKLCYNHAIYNLHEVRSTKLYCFYKQSSYCDFTPMSLLFQYGIFRLLPELIDLTWRLSSTKWFIVDPLLTYLLSYIRLLISGGLMFVDNRLVHQIDAIGDFVWHVNK